MANNSIFIYKFNLWYQIIDIHIFNCKTGIKVYLWWIFIVKSNNKSRVY